MKGVVIFGDGLIATLAQYYLTHDSVHEVVAFTVDGAYVNSSEHRGLPMVPFEEIAERYPPDDYGMIVSLGYSKMNKLRETKYRGAKAIGYRLISYVASTTVTWPAVDIGDNCFIQEGCIIQPMASIGNNVIMWGGAFVGHETVIGDNCFLSAHVVVSGNVTVGANSFIGINASIRDKIDIGSESVIGAGALIMKDVKPKSVVVGPAGQYLPTTSDRIPRL